MKKSLRMAADKVCATNFYQDAGDMILQNWFLYEYANILYAKIEESPRLAGYRKKQTAAGISAFCVYFSKRLRRGIFNAATGKTKGVIIDARYVYEHYPGNTYAQTQRLLEAAADAWKEHLAVCSNCPNLCIANGYETTEMFGNLEKTGWPTV